MLLVSRSGLVVEDAVEVFNYHGFHCPLVSLCKILSPFMQFGSVPVSFPHLHAVGQLWLISLQG